MADDTRRRTALTLAEAKAAVQEFQVRRLERDFRDLRRSPEYGALCEFFATEIYSASDFTERNEGFRRVTTKFRGILGEEIYTGLIGLLDLHALTDRLDDEVAGRLTAAGWPVNFSEKQFEDAYRQPGNYDDRRTQIAMITESFRFTHRVSQMPFIGVVLRSARLAAGIFTRDRSIEVLGRAHTIMRDIRSIEPFAAEVERRELERLDRIFER
jgi:hypothetical protein